MHIVLCADRHVLPGLHVAMFSLLEHAGARIHFHLFSDNLTESNCQNLAATLEAAGKPFDLTLHPVDAAAFRALPPLHGSHATYYRLHAFSNMEVDRFLYLDADTLCERDVSRLLDVDFQGRPAAWVPEAPLDKAADREVAAMLGDSPDDFYFNAGVLLVNTAEWHRQKISERALQSLATIAPAYHDQSALNIVLHRNSAILDPVWNTLANHRCNWPHVRSPYGQNHRLIHFLDCPKPWHPASRFIHPQYPLWHSVLEKTAFGSLRAWHRNTPSPPVPPAARRKTFKDKLLFTAYRHHLPIPIKGIA